MNIVEAYIKFNKGLIILISGLSGSNKTQLAKFTEEDFKIKRINMEHFTVKHNDNIITLSNGVKLTDWDHINAYDWTAINNEVNKNKKSGIVVSGPYFPTDKLKFEPDFHINIKVSKQVLVEQRLKYIKSNPNKFKYLESVMSDLDEQMMLLIVNQMTYPHYLDYTAKSKIDKYVNSKDLTAEKIYDQITDFIFFKIQDFLKDFKDSEGDKNKEEDDDDLGMDDLTDLDDSSSISVDKDSSDTMDIEEDSEKNPPIYLGEVADEDKWWEHEQ